MILATAALQIDDGTGLMGDFIAAGKIILFACVLLWVGLKIIRKVSNSDTYGLLANLFLLSFALRIAFGLFLLRIVPLLVHGDPYLSRGFISDDGILFDAIAFRGTEAMLRGVPPLQTFSTGQTGAIGYLFLMSTTYLLVGHELLAIQVMNSFFGSLIPVFGFLLALQIMPYAQARLAGFLMAFYPEQIMYAGSHQKDMSIVLGFLVGLWLVTRLFQATTTKERGWYIGFLIAMCGYLALARIYYSALLGVAVVAGLGLDTFRRLNRKQLLQGSLLFVALIAMMILMIAIFLPRTLRLITNPLAAAQGFYQTFTEGGEREGSLYALFRFPYNIILFPLVILGFLMNPFILWPFLSPSPIYTMLIPTILVWYTILPFIVYGFATTHQAGTRRMIFIVVCGAIFVLIITGSGLTTGGRSKLPLHPYALMYAVLGFQALKEGKIWMRWLAKMYAAGLVSIIVLYSLLKMSIPTDLLIMTLFPNVVILGIIGVALWQRYQIVFRAETTTVPGLPTTADSGESST